MIDVQITLTDKKTFSSFSIDQHECQEKLKLTALLGSPAYYNFDAMNKS